MTRRYVGNVCVYKKQVNSSATKVNISNILTEADTKCIVYSNVIISLLNVIMDLSYIYTQENYLRAANNEWMYV